MSKRSVPNPRSVPNRAVLCCGIDVSAATVAAAVEAKQGDGFEQREFANSAAGHRQLIAWLGKRGGPVRVSLEATGIYSLDVALALDRADGIEVAVLNPRTVHRFAESLRRSKTDAADAVALAEYSRRMEFVAWVRPSVAALGLRAISRHIQTLTEEHARLKNRLHAAQGSASTPRCVREDLRKSMAGVEKRLARLRREAVSAIAKDAGLQRKFEHLTGIKGIGEVSAVELLGELAGLDPEMTVRQWVAQSGLDPVHQVSGTSVHKPSRISRRGNRRLRRALYMPALSATRFDPHMKAFYTLLLARNKTKMQALSAVARKLLHAIFGIFKTGTAWDGAKLFPQLIIAS
jgi:transposase